MTKPASAESPAAAATASAGRPGTAAATRWRRREFVLGAWAGGLPEAGLGPPRRRPSLGRVVRGMPRLALDEVGDLRVGREVLHERRVAAEGVEISRFQPRQLVLRLL